MQLFHQQQIACALNLLRDVALIICAESGNPARQDFPGIGDVACKNFRRGERHLGRRQRLLGFGFTFVTHFEIIKRIDHFSARSFVAEKETKMVGPSGLRK